MYNKAPLSPKPACACGALCNKKKNEKRFLRRHPAKCKARASQSARGGTLTTMPVNAGANHPYLNVVRGPDMAVMDALDADLNRIMDSPFASALLQVTKETERARCAAIARKFNCEHVAQEIEAVSE
jgi:hypothetical protein